MSNKDLMNEDFSEAEKEIAENGTDTWYKITLNNPNFSKDKIWHMLVCMCITFVTFLFGMSFGYAALGFGIAILAGFGKELYDKYVKKTKFDWGDIVADLIGSFGGIILATIVLICK